MARIEHILVVGGGTSGWLSAAFLARKLGANQPNGVKITLIESSEIGTIGVGEATVPPMRTVIASLGLDEAEFMRQTSATFKLGIRFDDWLRTPGETGPLPDSFYHAFGEAGRFGRETQEFMAPYWIMNHEHLGQRFGDHTMIEGKLCDAGRGPKRVQDPQFGGPMAYAYHFDAGLLAKLLEKVGIENGVEHLVGTVTNVKLAEDGAIEALETKEHGELKADLYLDCTGFSAHLIEKAMGVEFHSLTDSLFCDEALACQIPYPTADQPIPPFTVSTAQPNGWIWDIPLNNRKGVGHIFSSKYTDIGAAEELLASYVGPAFKDLKTRHLKMRIGSRRQQWSKNCVSVGLSAGFLEPLESTGIHILDIALRRLVEYLPPIEEMPLAAKQFNETMNYCFADIVDFIKMHYALSRRTDSDFWIDNQRADTMTETLRDKLRGWRYRMPSVHEFENISNVFGLSGHMQILYGMDYLPDLRGQEQRFMRGAESLARAQELHTLAKGGFDALPDHRSLIDDLYANGFRPPPAPGPQRR